jgi:hypothetical protein
MKRGGRGIKKYLWRRENKSLKGQKIHDEVAATSAAI